MVSGYQLAPNVGAEALRVGSLQAIRPAEYAFNVLGLPCAECPPLAKVPIARCTSRLHLPLLLQ